MSEHNCEKNEKFMEIATFSGTITEAVKNIRGDLNVVFNELREIKECLQNVKRDITKKENEFLKYLLASAGGGLFTIAVVFLRKWVAHG